MQSLTVLKAQLARDDKELAGLREALAAASAAGEDAARSAEEQRRAAAKAAAAASAASAAAQRDGRRAVEAETALRRARAEAEAYGRSHAAAKAAAEEAKKESERCVSDRGARPSGMGRLAPHLLSDKRVAQPAHHIRSHLHQPRTFLHIPNKQAATAAGGHGIGPHRRTPPAVADRLRSRRLRRTARRAAAASGGGGGSCGAGPGRGARSAWARRGSGAGRVSGRSAGG